MYNDIYLVIDFHVVIVCPLQPSSYVNPGCPGPERSVPVSYLVSYLVHRQIFTHRVLRRAELKIELKCLSRLACPISSQVTDHCGDPCNRTGEVHHVDPFHSLDNLNNIFVSITFCRNSVVCNVRNGAVIELSFVVSIIGFPRH